MIDTGKGAQRKVPDVHLSRYACYLIVQNGDPSKPVIAQGQTYFAVRTREAELIGELAGLTEAQRRLHMRAEVGEHNLTLAAAAQNAGVQSRDFSTFQDHGYRGLYNGENARDIATRKGLRSADFGLDGQRGARRQLVPDHPN
jgi:DNA-damage-inducible protein D